jgi:hypothetical protein
MAVLLLTGVTGAAAHEEAPRPRPGPGVFFVAPAGKDHWSGRLPAPDATASDGPFATLHRARDAVRQLKASSGALQPPVTVVLRGGTYFLQEPLRFTPEDSGTDRRPIVYAAYPGESVVISGGRRITGWKPVTRNGKRLWVASVPEARDGRWPFRQLWIDGQRRVPARHPSKGYLRVAEVPDATPETAWHDGQTRFRFHAGDLPACKKVSGAEIVVMNRWTESHLPITGIDTAERLVTFAKRSVFRLEPGDLYYLQHCVEALDTPGEWLLDADAGQLYYLPLPGEDVRKADVVAPALSELVRLEGKPETGQFVEHLTFRGLTFSHAEWWFPSTFEAGWPKPDVGGFPQAAIGVPGALRAEGSRAVSFEECAVTHVGTYGIELGRGCRQNRIVRCELTDLGAGGIKIGETVQRESEAEQAHGNAIEECHIHDGGRIFPSAVGVWIGQSYNNRIARNHVHDFYYTGFSIGWTWGYGATLARANIVERNHVHHIGARADGECVGVPTAVASRQSAAGALPPGPILSDMAAIYTLGRQPGTIIRENRFHDIAGLRYGGWGIYFDEGSSEIIAERNLVYRTTHGGFHQHYGRENIVRNNIFALGRDAQIQRTRREPHLSFTFEGNIVYWREGALLAGDFSDSQFAFDRNLYWREGGGEIPFAALSWDAWRAKGMDRSSRIADPLFAAVEKEDFRLKPDSPALELGWIPISTPDAKRSR